MVKNTGKNINNFLVVLKNLLQNLKLLQIEQFKKTAEATGDLIDNKIADKTTKFSKLHHRIIKLKMKKKYLERDIYFQKKDKKSLMI